MKAGEDRVPPASQDRNFGSLGGGGGCQRLSGRGDGGDAVHVPLREAQAGAAAAAGRSAQRRPMSANRAAAATPSYASRDDECGRRCLEMRVCVCFAVRE